MDKKYKSATLYALCTLYFQHGGLLGSCNNPSINSQESQFKSATLYALRTLHFQHGGLLGSRSNPYRKSLKSKEKLHYLMIY